MRPAHRGQKQLDALRLLHEGLATNFAAALSSLVRCPVEVKLATLGERTYGDLLSSLESPTCLNLVRAAPPETRLALDVSLAILFPLIDRLLGGRESTTRAIARRPLTDIELRLAAKITGVFLDELRRAWQDVLPIEPSVERVESDPRLVQIAPPNEVVLLIGFELTLGEARGMVQLCIPATAVEQMKANLTASGPSANHSSDPSADSFAPSTVEVAVELALTAITTTERIGLRVGDIITTEHHADSPLRVFVSGQPKFLARPGVYQGHKAVRLEQAVETPSAK
jgi:flagellar motor switch protein FliM